jgi:hypothetical protein
MSASMKRSATISRHTLERTTRRAIAFLSGVGGDAAIRSALAKAGWTDAEDDRGWSLLRAAVSSPVSLPVSQMPSAVALEELALWAGPGFARVRAALLHMHPEQGAFVLNGIPSASPGDRAVLFVGTFLERCTELERSKERAATRKEDRQAIATLEARGITKALRDHLRALVEAVEKPTTPVTPTDHEEQKRARIMGLRAWLIDWTETARAVLPQRSQLLRLGIGQRAKAGQKPADPPHPPSINSSSMS